MKAKSVTALIIIAAVATPFSVEMFQAFIQGNKILEDQSAAVVQTVSQIKNSELVSLASSQPVSAVPSVPQSACPGIITQPLVLGSRSSQVITLQRILNNDPATLVAKTGIDSPGNESNYFDAKTKAAVIKFQKKYGIYPGGGLGTATRAKLNNLCKNLTQVVTQAIPAVVPATPVTPATFACLLTKPLVLGVRDRQVITLQKILNLDPATVVAKIGIGSKGNESNYFGPITKAAVVKFQKKYHISAGGGLGASTRTKLVSVCTQLQLKISSLRTTGTATSTNANVVIGSSGGGGGASYSSGGGSSGGGGGGGGGGGPVPSPTTYTITPTAGSNGTISPSTPTTVTSGNSQAFTITPNSGYNIATLTIDGSSISTSTSYTFSNVTADHTIATTFSLISIPTGPLVIDIGGNNTGDNGLVGYWKLDETSGPALDSSGNGHSGTWGTGITSSTNVPSLSFTDSHAASFNGSADISSASTVANFGTGDFTASAWAKTSSLVDYDPIFGNYNGSTGFSFYVRQPSASYLPTVSVGALTVVGSSAFTSGTWHHVAVTRNSGNVAFYLDGVSQGGGSATGNINRGVFGIGQLGNNSNYWNGSVDDVRLYNRGLSQTEISRLNSGDLHADNPVGYLVNEGTALVFSGSITSGTSPFVDVWNFGDGTGTTTATTTTPTHTYTDNGLYTVAFAVTDGASASSYATTSVTVANVAPTPNAHGPYSAQANQSISFTGSATDPSSVDTSAGFTYLWDFGDNSTSATRNPSHSYSGNGTYTVSLGATDKDGSTSTTTTSANIGGPTVNAGNDQSANEGASVSFSGASASGGTTPYTYAWDFGDSSTASTLNPTHTYGDQGSYTATLSVTDANSLIGTDFAIITVNNVAPTPNANGPYQDQANNSITFTASATDSTADVLAGFTYAWNFGDGSGTSTGSTATTKTHTYSSNSTYTVTLSATDKDGGVGYTSTNAVIANPSTSPVIFLTPSVLADVRSKASNNTSQWQSLKTRLDANLNVVMNNSYEASILRWISDYALGYKALENSDPTTAAKYADKALGLMVSGTRDYQFGNEQSRQYLARGDGVTKTFTIPNSDYVSSSFNAYLGTISILPIVKGSANTKDDISSPYYTVIKVSNTSDGNPDYTQGVDWQFPTDDKLNYIDWSLGGSEPTTGATYYVTADAVLSDSVTHAYSLSGNQITFTNAPAADQAIYLEYVYGTHANDYSTLAYQQTGRGLGGFRNILIDTGYPSRFLMMHEAIGYDWLYDYAGFSSSFKNQVAALMIQWSDNVRDFGYQNTSVASNYGAGEYVGRMMVALALSGNRNANDSRLLSEIGTYRSTYEIPLLSNPTKSLKGGHNPEGWNYGPLAITNILTADQAYETAGFGTVSETHTWANELAMALIEEQPTQATVYNDGDWYEYPTHFPGGTDAYQNNADDPFGRDMWYLIATTTGDSTVKTYANNIIQNYSGAQSGDWQDVVFRDSSAPASNWTSTLPLAYHAYGTGVTLARADWNYNSTWLGLHLGNVLFGGHQTIAQGTLQISRGADDLLPRALAVANELNDQSLSKYYNTVVIDDNGDGAQTYRFSPSIYYGYLDSYPDVVTNALATTSQYVYVSGDYKATYSVYPGGNSGSATQLERQLFYIRPDYIVVHDRVGTVQASYPKQLRWHFQNSPTISGNSFTEAVGSSKLFGTMFSSSTISTAMNPVTINSTSIYETITTNTVASSSVQYTTVFETASSSASSMDANARVASSDGKIEGAKIGNDIVMFGTYGALSGSTSYSFTATNGVTITHYITDLTASHTYTLTGAVQGTATASSQGVLTFTTTGTGSSQSVTVAP
jgi:PKD repeat protein